MIPNKLHYSICIVKHTSTLCQLEINLCRTLFVKTTCIFANLKENIYKQQNYKILKINCKNNQNQQKSYF